MEPNPIIETIPFLSNVGIEVATLRLDQIHPVISGNKWYKLKYYLQAAKKANATTIASFGGPYSNHLVALAFAASLNGIKSIGYVRLNKDEPKSVTLLEAISYGMELVYLGRSAFQEKKMELLDAFSKSNTFQTYYVDEGGYGIIGAKGASIIMTQNENIDKYQYILCAVGTGTMIAGIINAAKNEQKIIGIPVLKNEGSIEFEIRSLLHDKEAKFELLHSFHQGGYAKTTPDQIAFMNHLWDKSNISTDIVYTGKVFFALNELLKQKYFKSNSNVLVIHSGGLQGNRSLTKGILNF